MLKYASASIALLALSNPALAASCASPVEASALKTAVLQQELMVAALQCHESGAYNRFVNTFRPELQTSDAALKAFFVRRGGEHGEAGYDAFKTKAANLSALEEARDAGAFCADAHVLYQAALAHHGSLMSFVDARSGAADVANVCIESRPGPVLAQAEIKAPAPPRMITVVTPAAAALTAAPATFKLAKPPVPTLVAVAGVPAHSLPAIPYRHEEVAPQDNRAEQADAGPSFAERDRALEDREAARNEELENDAAQSYAAQDEAPPPPPRPRYYPVRAQRYADPYAYAYAPRSYGPPQGWQNDYRNYPAPPPAYWYQRGYSNW